jgi:DNA polymerase-3 subunit delta'
MSPSVGRWQIIIVEDADRMRGKGADALLRAIEEPSKKTVWLLCAPTPQDVTVTIRSRCRHLGLVTPSTAAVAALLESEGIPPQRAVFAARVTQGHIGRARAMATDPQMESRRLKILEIPTKLGTLGGCLEAASWAVKTAVVEAKEATAAMNAEEKGRLEIALGLNQGRSPRGAAGQMKELEEEQALRATRLTRDHLDTVLLELTSFYRDVLILQMEAGTEILNVDFALAIKDIAAASTAESTIRRLDAIQECREAIGANVAQLLAFEALMVSLA